jgi:spore maturation protein CgeB
MVEERFSAKTFFKPGEEIITYHPMDSIEIEGILSYYLEDMPQERENIAVAGRERVFKDHTLYSRGELLGTLLDNIIKQATPPEEGNEQQEEQSKES